MTTPVERPASPKAPVAFRVAIAQVAPCLGNVAANLQMHLDNIAKAREAGADLVVFPELSLTGYYLRDQVPEVAEPVDGPSLRAILDSAGSMSVVCGFVEEGHGHRFYNAAAFSEAGSIVRVHRKVYLPTYGMFDEQRYFAAGNRVCAFDTRFGRVGLLICEDAWHLDCGVILQADGIDVLIIVANSPGRGVREATLGSQQTWDHVTQTFAMFLNVPVIFANRVGYEDGVCFWGGSQVVGPSGTPLADAGVLEPALVTADIDPRETRLQRILTPLGRDQRLHLIIDEQERIRHESYGRGTRL
ncbi:MAG TPA: nitrilase-related carbon-nitrogen hydrolase [Isosphaeraceae bacterium]|nr:nitrilase-related carbon-nitrogen hydrolase [Isosphaeraceae bacterium]